MRIERVVVNASPLICLCKSGLSEILPTLFSDVIVPAAVHNEITAKEDVTRACAPFFAHSQVKIASDIVIPSSIISWDLGEGEALCCLMH
jgi:predicted nucleic acid-binding protein